MSKEPTDNLEEQRQKTRRRLLKIGVYSIPVVTTLVASREALATIVCGPKCPPKGKTGTES